MAAVYDYEWNQGEDLSISLIYKSGPEGETVPVDLTNYSFRMDIVALDGNTITVLNDKAIADADPYVAGNQPDNTYEVTLGTAGEIEVLLPRSLTLPGGIMYPYLTAGAASRVFSYDMFLRDPLGKQRKILGGTITALRSVTLWQ